MVPRPKIAWPIVFATSLVFGCAGHSSSPQVNDPTPDKSNSQDPNSLDPNLSPESPPGLGPTHSPAERERLRAAECEAKGGRIVGDIGDGAIHRKDYRCENGQTPIGTIVAEPEGPVAMEGSVCCPGDEPSANG